MQTITLLNKVQCFLCVVHSGLKMHPTRQLYTKVGEGSGSHVSHGGTSYSCVRSAGALIKAG